MSIKAVISLAAIDVNSGCATCAPHSDLVSAVKKVMAVEESEVILTPNVCHINSNLNIELNLRITRKLLHIICYVQVSRIVELPTKISIYIILILLVIDEDFHRSPRHL